MANFGGGQPFDYSTVAVDPMTNYTHGVQQASNVINIERADAEYKRNEDVRNQVQALMTSGRPITSAEIAPLIANASPELSQQIAKAHGLLTVEQQQNKLKIASQVMSALQSGDSATAIKTLEGQLEAAKNSGDVATEHGAQLMIDQINIDPRKALMHIAVGYGSIPGFDKLLDLSADVAKRPLEQRKLEAETQSAESRAAADDEYYNARNDSVTALADERRAKAMAKASTQTSPDGVDYIEKSAELGFPLISTKLLVTKAQMDAFQREAAGMVKATGKFDPEVILNKTKDISQARATGRSAGSSKVLGQRENIDNALALLDDMKETNKKLNLSKLKYAGKIENWAKDATNDPEFVRFRTQRADNLFQLTNALKQNGITDKSIEIEEQAAALTMDESAFKAWYETQKKALERGKEQKEQNFGPRKDLSGKSTSKPVHWSELINKG